MLHLPRVMLQIGYTSWNPQLKEEVLVQTLGCRRKKLQPKEQGECEAKRVEAIRRKNFTPNLHTIRHVMDTITEYASASDVTT